MSKRSRHYAWVTGVENATTGDRSYVLRNLITTDEDGLFPESRSWLAVLADEEDGDRTATLIYWYGSDDNLDRDAVDGVEVIGEVGTGERPELPEGWKRRGS